MIEKLKNKKVHIGVTFGVLAVAALLFFNGGAMQDIAQSCSSDANRPCFEQEISNNLQAAASGSVKKEKLDTERGQTEFAACIKNEANRRGEERGRTKICDAEIIKYCEDAWNDDKNNKYNENRRIKKYEGKCEPDPGPTPPPTPSKNLLPPTVSFISPVSGRGYVTNNDMYFRVNVTNIDDYDYVKYGELMFNLARAGSVVQTFPYYPEAIPGSIGNALIHSIWSVPASLPAGNDYTLEAFFTNFPKKKVVSTPFSILGSSVTVNAHVVDAFTGLPLQAEMQYNQNGVYKHPLTDASGNFSITEPTTVYWESVIGVDALCHQINGFSSALEYRYDEKIGSYAGDNAFGIVTHDWSVNPWSIVPVTGPSVNIKIPMWPAVDIFITSDRPVTFEIFTGSIRGGGGPLEYLTSPSLARIIPLDKDVGITLTTQDGTTYASPILHLPRTYGCAPLKLIFKDGKSTWQY